MKQSSVTSLKVCVVAITLAMLSAAAAGTSRRSSTGQIAIAYVKPKNPAHERLHDFLIRARVLELVQEVLGPFLLPKLLTIRLEGCDGESDARYSESTIKVCYEYLDEILTDVPTETTASGMTPIDAIVGQVADAFFHEFAHALFDLQQIPVLGREEDAADMMSAMLMLILAKDEARGVIMGAAYWYADDLVTPITLKPTDFSAVHSTPHQRFFNLICLAYGANQEAFGDLVEKGYLPKERAEDCKSEFQQAAHAFNVLIRPHIDDSLARQVFGKEWMPDVNRRPPDRTPDDLTR